MIPDIYAAVLPVIDIFQVLDIPYHIGGSVASSALGVARTTLDVDLVADIQAAHVDELVANLGIDYYIDGEMIRKAIDEKSSFDLVHLETMIKVDVFLPKEDAYATESFGRKQLERPDGGELEVYFASAEDVVLHKLDWYRKGGEISERQWNDITGVLKVQAAVIDLIYLRRWASELGLQSLLAKALVDAGFDE